MQVSNAADATLPASFTVSASGTTTQGYGPTTVGPVAPGATQTIADSGRRSGNDITFTVSSGGTQLVSETITGGCLGQQEAA